MLRLNIDEKSPVPIYRQICDRVVELIESGALSPGDRLPPTRVLARTAGIHRSTVLRAYGELWALGHLESRPGSYSTVRRRTRALKAGRAAEGGVIDWDAIATPELRAVWDDLDWSPPGRAVDDGVIDFATLSADPTLIPFEDLRRSAKGVLTDEGRHLLDYGDSAGYPELREVLARRMSVHGIEVSTDEVIVTNGAQQALDLVLRLLTNSGDRVVVESPTYAAALRLFRLHGLEIDAVPMRSDGMDLDALAAALDRARPALVYTMPAFQNPTGITTSQSHRERLLGLCEAHGVPLLEDGFEEDMKYSGKAVLPIKSMDRQGVVIYVGTFSKVVFPGLRIGWIAAPLGCIRRLVSIQRVVSLGGSALTQAAIARFCQVGSYDAYLRRIYARYRRRMQSMLKGLAEHMPDGVEWTRPAGGCTVWMSVRTDAGEEEALRERFERDGVAVASGGPFFPVPPPEPHFRLSIACVDEDDIGEGCRRLGRSLTVAGAGSVLS